MEDGRRRSSTLPSNQVPQTLRTSWRYNDEEVIHTAINPNESKDDNQHHINLTISRRSQVIFGGKFRRILPNHRRESKTLQLKILQNSTTWMRNAKYFWKSKNGLLFGGPELLKDNQMFNDGLQYEFNNSISHNLQVPSRIYHRRTRHTSS